MKEAVSRAQVLTRMLKGYQAYFDIEQYEDGKDGLPLAAHCRFYVHSEKYVLVKKAKLWDADSNEYVYIFSVPELTKEIFERCKNYAYEDGMKLIDPKPGHMYSYITPVFICDTCTPEAEKALKRCRIYKSFHFSLHGWADHHTALIELSTGQIDANAGGRQTAKILKKVLYSQTRKGVSKQ